MAKTRFLKGDMVKTKVFWLSKSKTEYVYGIIQDIRPRSGIAYIQFLPLCNMEDSWHLVSGLEHANNPLP